MIGFCETVDWVDGDLTSWEDFSEEVVEGENFDEEEQVEGEFLDEEEAEEEFLEGDSIWMKGSGDFLSFGVPGPNDAELGGEVSKICDLLFTKGGVGDLLEGRFVSLVVFPLVGVSMDGKELLSLNK